MPASILMYFAPLEEPRIERNKLHALRDIVLLTLCAVLSGADGWEALEDFGREKLAGLRQFAPFTNGVPSDACIANVIARLSPKGFQECFRNWTQAVAKATGGEVSAVDGKTTRGSRDRQRSRHPLHRVSAWASTHRLVLGQEATEEKSNEITAIPKLLELLELKGCLVTIDAMGCQCTIAEQLVAPGGDYVLGLKGNQSNLREAVEDVFAVAQQANCAHLRYDYAEAVDKAHGRLELRRYGITEDLRTLPATDRWVGLRSMGMVERTAVIGETQTVEQRYFLRSLRADAQCFAHGVRGHGGVENRLHWRLEVVFGDDARRLRKGNAPTMMTSIRHLCINLFDQAPSALSLAKKRRKAAWNDDVRAKVVFG